MPIISIVVPVYKVEPYIHSCIDSILSQTFNNYELILVDDGSPDNCGVICDEYAKKDSRVHVIHQDNCGLAAARNAGVIEGRGQYFCFIDSDDLVHPQLLEYLYNTIIREEADLCICYAMEAAVCPDIFFDPIKGLSDSVVISSDETISGLMKIPLIKDVAWAKLIKARIVRENLFEPNRFYEDTITLKWFLEARRIAIISAKLYFYRCNPEGISKSIITREKAMDGLWAVSERLRWSREYTYKKLEQYYISRFLYESANAYNLVKKGDKKQAARIKKKAMIEWLKNRKNIQFKDGEKAYVLEMFFPLSMWIYWKIQSVQKH